MPAKLEHKFRVVASAEDARAVLADCKTAAEGLPEDAGKESKRLVRWDVTKAQRQVWAISPVVTMLIDGLVEQARASIAAASEAAAALYGDIPGFTAGTVVREWQDFGLPDGFTVTDAKGEQVTGQYIDRIIEPEQDAKIITGMVSRLLLGRKATG